MKRVAKVGLVAGDSRLAGDIKQAEHPHRGVGDYPESIVQRLLEPTLQQSVEHTVEIVKVREEIVDALATRFRHDRVITLGNRLDKVAIQTIVGSKHPTVITLPGIAFLLGVQRNRRHQRQGQNRKQRKARRAGDGRARETNCDVPQHTEVLWAPFSAYGNANGFVGHEPSAGILRHPSLYLMPLLLEAFARYWQSRFHLLGKQRHPEFLQHPAILVCL